MKESAHINREQGQKYKVKQSGEFFKSIKKNSQFFVWTSIESLQYFVMLQFLLKSKLQKKVCHTRNFTQKVQNNLQVSTK